MNVIRTRIDGPLILEPRVFRDERGYFFESWHRDRYRELGITEDFVQDNVSCSDRGVLRGLHFQTAPHAQGKLVSVLRGSVYDVAVDLRADSPTFRAWVAVELSDANNRQFYVPPGFAHGFLVTSPSAVFSYKCTAYYSPADERGVRWNDPEIGIEWPAEAPILSLKDQNAPLLGALASEHVSLPSSGATLPSVSAT